MSILATSPTDARMFSAKIAAALENVNAAIIVQQLNYWMQKERVGVVVDGVKYVYNTFVEWVNQQFPWLSPWQFRKAMSQLRSLGIVKVIRYKAKQWNQTNYYTLDCDRLIEFVRQKTATTIEISELRINSSQADSNQHPEMSDCDISLYESKNTNQRKQTNRQLNNAVQTKSSSFAAAFLDTPKEEKTANETAYPDNKQKKSLNYKTPRERKKTSSVVDEKINLKWKLQLKDLDNVGIQVNQTLISLIKSYPPEEVENAIALVKARKRSRHVPNPAGYFTRALEENWAEKSGKSDGSDIDTASVFRHWYDLARELGYCSGAEVRGGEQWVCLSGTWEKWSAAVERGYSLDYLKKIHKRAQDR
ncbi:MAG: hypothetical protein AAF652_17140 [Cyanobacteria bacterium P01_C01_bin.72]